MNGARVLVQFWVPMAPRGEGRHRTTKTGHCYTDRRTTTARQDVRAAASLAHRGAPLEGPLSLIIRAVRYKPKSWPAKRWAWDVNPDWDNLGKLVSDACNGILWRDDAQIVSGTVHKIQSQMVAGFHVEVCEADANDDDRERQRVEDWVLQK